MDSPERAPSVLSTLESDAQGASQEACALVEDGAPIGEPPLNGEVANEARPTEEVGGPPPRTGRHSLALS